MSDRATQSLRVIEVFASIQGESTRAGLPCAFVRLAGCNLRCSYCDTRYAIEEAGTVMDLGEVVERLEDAGAHMVCVTGGEPLLQPAAVPLAEELARRGHTVLVETNGTLDITPLPPQTIRVMDVKCPGSGECGQTLMSNLEALRPDDQVKFVLCDRADFDWAADFVRQRRLIGRCHVLFSPAHGILPAAELAEWILASGLQVRLQVQLHKLLWPDRSRGV